MVRSEPHIRPAIPHQPEGTMTTPLTARRTSLVGAVLAGLLLAGCAGASPSPEASALPSTPPSVAPSTEASDDLGPFACTLPIEGVGSTARAQITDVRLGEHDGFDRIVFEFSGGIPRFGITAVSPPFTADASGLPLDVKGEAFWQVRLDGGTRQLPDGGTSYDGPVTFEPGFARLVHLVNGGDFEAVSTWYVGLSDTSCIRVLALDGPDRLVIDIEH